jgi:phosphoesterase RecJ-like protein
VNNRAQNSLQELADFLKSHDDYVISGHVQPDGDVIGSTFAVYLILNKIGKKVKVSFEPTYIPKKYRFLQASKVYGKDEIKGVENFIAMECPALKRLGALEESAEQAANLINIDHHLDNDMYGTVNVVDSRASATTEIIYKLAVLLGAEITGKIADCLYVGLVTDTGRFQYSNTKAETLALAAELIKKGVEPNRIFENIYENVSIQSLMLLGKVINNFSFALDGKILWSYIEHKDTPHGTDPSDTENLINYIRSVTGPVVAVLIKINKEENKISLRSKGEIDVAKIAAEMQGGGHKNAAGFSSKMDKEQIIQWISEKVQEQLKTDK